MASIGHKRNRDRQQKSFTSEKCTEKVCNVVVVFANWEKLQSQRMDRLGVKIQCLDLNWAI